jgi:4-amino-4-deoxy-L-arabinose transferase-like glycosyltransferase
VALAIRLGVMSYKHTYEFYQGWDQFPFGYEMGRVARSIAIGQGFSSPYHMPTGPTAVVPPVYAYLLAGVFKLFGVYSTVSAVAILSLDSLFSALTCLSIFFIGDKISGLAVAAWAGWAWAFYPDAWFWAVKWVWETVLSAFLLSLVFLLTLHMQGSRRLRSWVGFGLLWALCALTNPALLSFLPFSLGWIWYRQYQRRSVCGRRVAAAVLAFVLGVIPWLVRNYLVFGQFIFIRDGLGLQLFLGSSETFFTKSGAYPARDKSEMERYRQLGELAYFAEKQREALRFLADYPGTSVGQTLRRCLFFWTGNWQLTYISWFSGRFIVAKFAIFTLLSVLAFLGLSVMIWNRQAEALPFGALFFAFPVVYYLTQVDPRYRHPIEPEMIILALYGMRELGSRFRVFRGWG